MNEEKQEVYKILELGTDEKNLHKHKNTGGLLYIDLSMIKFSNLSTYIRKQDKEIKRLNNIINELKWKPIEEYNKGNYDWVLVKYFDKDYECVPCIAEKRFDKWYNRNDEVIEFDVKYFMDMQQIDKLQELKGEDKE